MDKDLLFQVTAGVVVCKLATRLLNHGKMRLSYPLKARLKLHYSAHIFQAHARLDVPTYDDVAVQTQLEAASHIGGQSIAWATFTMVSGLVTTAVQIISQLSVLWSILREQRDGPLLAALSAIQVANQWFKWQQINPLRDGGTVTRWAVRMNFV